MLKNIEEAVQPLSQNAPSTPSTTQSTNPGVEANAIRAKVDAAIKESADLVAALEAVGAMYGIPASSIISDDAATSVRVEDDTIIAPPVPNPVNQTKVIMQAIGSVLDYISQRIDDKVNDYQYQNIQNGIKVDKMDMLSGGPKGKCIGIYDDDNGDEIHAYDSGAVDMPNTPAAIAKVAELRASNTIPSFDPSAGSKKPGDAYFNDEDDITNGVNMEAKADEAEGVEHIKEFSIAKQIQESAYHVNMIAKLHDTTHLGHDLLTRHGFDFVKPIDSVFQESKTEKAEEEKAEKKGKGKKKVTKEDIKYMKFDNSNIVKAVKLFNEARAEQDKDAEKIDMNKFINEASFKRAVDCLNKQFDCVINLRFFTDKSGYQNVGTQTMRDMKRNLSISKSKGFQLNGQPIAIFVFNRFFESNTADSSLFGQTMVSVILHEIFHNIACVLREENAKMSLSLVATLNAAGSTDDLAKKRTIITRYVDTLDDVSKSKLINKAAKRKLVKQLLAISAVDNSEAAVKNIVNNSKNRAESADKYIDSLISKYKKSVSKTSRPGAGRYLTWTLVAAAGAIGVAMGAGIPAIITGAVGVAGLLSTSLVSMAYINAISTYNSKQLYEEYYCDLFAGMYQLPIAFFVGNSKEKYTPNDFKTEKLNELAKLEKELHKNVFSSYPTPLERAHASTRVAKTLLAQKDLDPEIRKYCQWLVDNFSDIHKTDISTDHNSTTFSPEEAENLDKHLGKLISKNNITLTESFIQYFDSNEDVF
jgi:hypothetical protein